MTLKERKRKTAKESKNHFAAILDNLLTDEQKEVLEEINKRPVKQKQHFDNQNEWWKTL